VKHHRSCSTAGIVHTYLQRLAASEGVTAHFKLSMQTGSSNSLRVSRTWQQVQVGALAVHVQRSLRPELHSTMTLMSRSPSKAASSSRADTYLKQRQAPDMSGIAQSTPMRMSWLQLRCKTGAATPYARVPAGVDLSRAHLILCDAVCTLQEMEACRWHDDMRVALHCADGAVAIESDHVRARLEVKPAQPCSVARNDVLGVVQYRIASFM
jgi:hypothetical protein